mgnify:CR=1 FL=1
MQALLTNPQTLIAPTGIAQEAAIIALKGALNAETAPGFTQQLSHAVLSSRHSSLVVDLQHVDGLDSSGVMALVGALRLAREANKRFLLCSVSQSVRMILELTRLDQVLEIVESPVG